MKPIRTLTVDLENPERIIKRTSTDIMKKAKARSGIKRVEAQLLIKPAGLDLMKSSDRVILEQAIEIAKPELLVMGPLYKAFVDPGGRTSESVAIEVAKYLDYVRDTYKCALWLEHHAPLGESMNNRQLRPFGSAVWSRWPEFGLSLTPDITSGVAYTYDVKHFRGARDERQWPTKMKRGTLFPFEVLEFAKVTT
jgi:replicative DNA helicase